MASISNVSKFWISKVFLFGVIFAVLFIEASTGTNEDIHLKDLTLIVNSQSNSYHKRKADIFKDHLKDQLEDLNLSEEELPNIYFLHETEGLPQIGSWTLFPVFSKFPEIFKKTKWTFICDEDTRVKLPKLLDVLKQFDSSEELFLGRELHDSAITIIHHYYGFDNPASFLYPDTRAGFLLSLPLVERLSEKLVDLNIEDLNIVDFSIDAKHEFAKILNEKFSVTLTPVPQLCVIDSPECVTFDAVRFPQCGSPIPNDDLIVAVKTCHKFHNDRISVVKKTWAKESSNIEYFSDKEDPSIPTINLGIPNTERGHCGKTMAIIRRAAENKDITTDKWLLIADDDTIISLAKLRLLLACYDVSEPAALGERYGYLASRGYGYDYITGGGGMIFSWPLVKQLAEDCKCPENDSPDDMILGMCLKRLDVPITHIPYIHQARMEDYSSEFLKHRSHVSFHKHWECDPEKTYKLLQEDAKTLHDEL